MACLQSVAAPGIGATLLVGLVLLACTLAVVPLTLFLVRAVAQVGFAVPGLDAGLQEGIRKLVVRQVGDVHRAADRAAGAVREVANAGVMAQQAPGRRALL